ncbi:MULTISPECIES: hypothetical protein [unclassified Sphingomonas]|uniref:hypothetical protein n=1 Tax=unclassified Sphingomonas TaxID=196159 RepID=UPI00226ACE9D|nr:MULTISPECIES: hypothetical protein [unclassified Sphingomonas]
MAIVRATAERHNIAWSALVPSRDVVDWSAEAHEEAAFVEMAEAKHALRQHLCETYGISAEEFAYLALG